MLDRLDRPSGDAATAIPSASLAGRQALFFTLVAAMMAGLLWLAATALSVGGLDGFDIALLALFAVTLPWSVIGFWNATIGFLIMRFARNPTAVVCPVAANIRGDEPIRVSTAIVICIRNEVPDRVLRNLKPLMSGLVAAGVAERFHVYVLSDTSDPEIALAEDAQFAAFADAWADRLPVTFRRREVNTGFKAGNVRDFCERWGDRHEIAVTLDADSFMTAEAVLRLVRVMQANPRLGILQGLVVGMPSTSAFARIFQFGMRLGMRSYTIGGAWWQGDCGPYWGHNAAVRLAPFIAHCHIPPLPYGGPLGGHVLSHDQVEAVLMRRAGYEVRVLPEEDLGWEENPPTLIEFIRRDLRWCQGTLQYWHFLFWPGIPPVSRYQLAFAVLMFIGSPAWMGLLVVGTLAVALAQSPAAFIRAGCRHGAARGRAGHVVCAEDRDRARRADAPETAPRLRRRLALRRQRGDRDDLLPDAVADHVVRPHRVPHRAPVRTHHRLDRPDPRRSRGPVVGRVAANYGRRPLLGLACIGILGVTHPSAIPYALFIAGGLALSVPLAVVTALPWLGRAVRAHRRRPAAGGNRSAGRACARLRSRPSRRAAQRAA